MDIKPLVSIVIPVYNAQSTINKCIDSILDQTYDNNEVILVNDGSKDHSLKICLEYAKQHNNIKVIDQINQGVSVARNHGIEAAKGKYITFIDSDDWIGKDYLKGFHFDEFDVDLYVEGIDYYITHRKQYLNMFNYNEYLLDLQDHNNVFKVGLPLNGCPVAKLYKRDIIIKHNLRFNKNFAINEDHLFVTEYISKINTVYLSSTIEYFYVYDISKNSLTKRYYSPETYLEIARAMDVAYNSAYGYSSSLGKEEKIAKYIYGPQQIINALFSAEAYKSFNEYFDRCKTLWVENNYNHKNIISPIWSSRVLSRILDSKYIGSTNKLGCIFIIRYSKTIDNIKNRLRKILFR